MTDTIYMRHYDTVHWSPVQEGELPESEGKVLVTIQDGEHIYSSTAHYYHNGEVWMSDGEVINVIAWAAMPFPYERLF